MEAARVQGALDGVDRLVLGEQGEREPAGPTPGYVDRFRCLFLDPLRVARLQAGRQPAHVAPVHGRQRAANRHGGVTVGTGELELLQTGEAADERRLLAIAGSEPEGG